MKWFFFPLRKPRRPTGGEDSPGLGLSIVRKLVAALEGRVELEGQLGRGSRFTLSFPLAPEPEKGSETDPVPPSQCSNSTLTKPTKKGAKVTKTPDFPARLRP